MKKETLIWQIMVFILSLIFVLTIREYLLDKNEIEAETARAHCIVEAKKINADSLYGMCGDIKTYKLKFNR